MIRMKQNIGLLIGVLGLGLITVAGEAWADMILNEGGQETLYLQSNLALLSLGIVFILMQALLLYRCWKLKLFAFIGAYLTLLVPMLAMPSVLPVLGADDYVTYMNSSRIVIFQILFFCYWCVVISAMLSALLECEAVTPKAKVVHECLVFGNLIPFLMLMLYRNVMNGMTGASQMLHRNVLIVALSAILIPISLSLVLVKNIQGVWEPDLSSLALQRAGIYQEPPQLSRMDSWCQLVGLDEITPKPETENSVSGLFFVIVHQAPFSALEPVFQISHIMKKASSMKKLIAS